MSQIYILHNPNKTFVYILFSFQKPCSPSELKPALTLYPNILILILPTCPKQIVWTALGELIVSPTLIQTRDHLPNSPYCTTHSWPWIGRRSFPLISCWGLKLMNSFLPGNFSTISPGQDEVYRRVRRISTITAVSFWEHAIIAWEWNRQVDALVSWSSRSRTPHDEGISGEASKMRDSISVWALKSFWLLHITKSSRISLARHFKIEKRTGTKCVK